MGRLQQQQEAQARQNQVPKKPGCPPCPAEGLGMVHPPLCSSTLMLQAEEGSSWAFPPIREPLGMKGTVEMTWFGVQML